ncbi:hypothetical protein PanWU01x14_263260 [Parasponia andersonii]|uniref:Uncharacterized protein n=1 Tax=Parasponia andersonii TaxID=3476 RepID=A0A2P5B7V3_PARAD|nr:hypothetical protein PanWU01x14_263260 [Parasponia andersonii]
MEVLGKIGLLKRTGGVRFKRQVEDFEPALLGGMAATETTGTTKSSMDAPPTSSPSSLRALIGAKDPDLVFLMETKLNYVAMNNLWRYMRFSNDIVVQVVGLAEYCASYGNRVDIELVSATNSVITVEVSKSMHRQN